MDKLGRTTSLAGRIFTLASAGAAVLFVLVGRAEESTVMGLELCAVEAALP